MAKKKKVNLSEEARKAGIPYQTLLSRINKGWSLHKATTTPVRAYKKSSSSTPQAAPVTTKTEPQEEVSVFRKLLAALFGRSK